MAQRLVQIKGVPEAFHDARDLATNAEEWLQNGAEAARAEVERVLQTQLHTNRDWREIAEFVHAVIDEDGDLAIVVEGPPSATAQAAHLELGSPEVAPQPVLRSSLLQGAQRGQWQLQKAIGV